MAESNLMKMLVWICLTSLGLGGRGHRHLHRKEVTPPWRLLRTRIWKVKGSIGCPALRGGWGIDMAPPKGSETEKLKGRRNPGRRSRGSWRSSGGREGGGRGAKSG